MLKAALSGSYVNFGVFRLYGVDALDNALNTYVKLLLSIPQTDLVSNIELQLQSEYRTPEIQMHQTFRFQTSPEFG